MKILDKIGKWSYIQIGDDIYRLSKSSRKNKKYDVFLFDDDNKWKYIISFGDSRYQQFKDKLKLYSGLDHLDKTRKKNYYARHGESADKSSAKFWSNNILW